MRQSALPIKTRKDAPKDEVSINASLLVRAGFIEKLTAGVYTYLPLGLRVLNNIEQIIREEMNAIGGVEILMPTLHPKENWVATGRWDTVDVLFKLLGAGDKEYALGATHEEIITPLAKQFIFSYKDLPCSLYQIQTKFRNEPRAKSGLLRGREFRMKDMYSFHATEADLNEYYERAVGAYHAVYRRAGIGAATYMTFASGGAFSKFSHEFQMVTEFGEDTIHVCEACRIAVNKEVIADQPTCPSCGAANLAAKKAIEVGNIFKLMTRFSEPVGLAFANEDGTNAAVIMGTYGLGSSRLMGAIVEAYHDDKGIVWPEAIAPFQVHLVSLCRTDESARKADAFYAELTRRGVPVLYDDRPDVRAGEKFSDADLIGIPTRMVVSEKTLAAESVEVKKRSDSEATLTPLENVM